MQSSKLICRRCAYEVQSYDLYCQECGLKQETALLNEETVIRNESFESSNDSIRGGEFGWPALSDAEYAIAENAADCDHDQNPLADDHVFDNFEQAGPPITSICSQSFEFANYQLDLTPVAVCQAAGELQGDINHVYSESKKSASGVSLLEADGQQTQLDAEPDNGLGMRGGWFMVASNYAVAASVCAFLSVLVCFVYTNFQNSKAKTEEKKALSLSTQISSHAQNENWEGLYRQLIAAKILGQLSPKQEQLFDEAAYRLGNKEMQLGNLEKALEYFASVSILSEHYVRAKEIIFQYATPDLTPKQEPRSRRRRQASQSWQQSAPPLNTERILSIPELKELSSAEGQDQTADFAGSSSPPSSQNEPQVRKFSESEISDYNRLLRRHFEKKRAKQPSSDTGVSGQSPADANAGSNPNSNSETAASKQENPESGSGKSEQADPPTFREWLNSGKRSF